MLDLTHWQKGVIVRPSMTEEDTTKEGKGLTSNGHDMLMQYRCCGRVQDVSAALTAVAIGSDSRQAYLQMLTINLDDEREGDADETFATMVRTLRLHEGHDSFEVRPADARLIHFPEGATCAPDKRIMFENGPEEVGPSDWGRVEWAVLRAELDAISKLAAALKLWAVFGSVYQLTPPHRPHNSLYAISDREALVARYGERMLSNTKVSFMYSPGKVPVTFGVDGIRFGCALGMEAHYPEIFTEYERLEADCVLFSTTGETLAAAPAFVVEALGHAASNTYWASYSAHAPQSLAAPSSIAAPDGRWAALCEAAGAPSLAVTDIAIDRDNPARP